MNHAFRICYFAFIILLTCAIWSCSSSRHVESSQQNSTSYFQHSKSNASSLIAQKSKINLNQRLDISGLTIEFFPPDSAHPDARAAPKSITIKSAAANTNMADTTDISADIDLAEDCKSSRHEDNASSESHQQKSSPPLGPLALAAIGAALILTFSLMLRRLK